MIQALLRDMLMTDPESIIGLEDLITSLDLNIKQGLLWSRISSESNCFLTRVTKHKDVTMFPQ